MNENAQQLGKLAKGKRKSLTDEERKRRSEWMRYLNAMRAAKKGSLTQAKGDSQ